MRAIAVAAVVIYHAFPNRLPRGFLGVDIFFVISGFLITGIISNDLRNGAFSLARFYTRRVKRIVPALLVVMAASLVLGWFLMLPVDYRQFGWHTIGGALFFSNIQYWLETGYFDKSADVKPFLHLWSLSVEEQFYLIWPLLLWATAKRVSWFTFTVCIAVLSFIAQIVVGQHDPNAAFYSPVTRFWELMLGAIVALAPTRYADGLADFARIRPRLHRYGSLTCLLLIIASVAVGQSSPTVPIWWNLLPTVGTAALMFGGLDNTLGNTVLASRGMVWLGKISYPLYLWHWPLLVFLLVPSTGVVPAWSRVAAVAASVVLAWLTYAYVERPIRFGTYRFPVALPLCGGLIALAVVGFVVYRANGFPLRIPEPLRDFVMVDYDYNAGARVGQCWLTDTAPADGFAPICLDEQPANRKSVLLWGDSHAGRLWVGLAKTYGEEYRVGQFTRNSCPPVLDFGQEFCRKSNAYTFSVIAKQRPTLVVMYAAWDGYSQFANPNIDQALTATISRLQAIGAKRVLVIGPPPRWTEPLPNLLAAYWRTDFPRHRVPTVMKLGLAPATFDMDRQLRASVPPASAAYVSLIDKLCSAEGCLTQTGPGAGGLITADYGHLTASGAEYVARLLPIRDLAGP
jgi:peptidoglycan/LPS O-acetylase OafA/YrhL